MYFFLGFTILFRHLLELGTNPLVKLICGCSGEDLDGRIVFDG